MTDQCNDGHTGEQSSTVHARSTPSPANDINTDLTQILREFMGGEEQRIEDARRILATEVLPALVARGVAHIEIAYSGYGDSGAIDGVQYRDAGGLRVVRDNLPPLVREKLESCALSFLPAGFEINEGGHGTLTINLPARTITIQHEPNELIGRSSTRDWKV